MPVSLPHPFFMKALIALPAISFALLCGLSVNAQESKPATAAEKTNAAPAAAPKPKATQEELEAKFRATLTKATFTGRWCSIKDGELGPEKEDKYTILGVSKLGGDVWVINARIQYGKKDITAPIPVQVKWAGDTPVIVVDNVGVPGSGSYSARVMIYEQTYAGSWTGGDHGGLLRAVLHSFALEITPLNTPPWSPPVHDPA